MSTDLKITFITDYVESVGGATRMMLWVASCMADLGCEVEVCSISYSEFLESSISANCQYHSLDAPLRTNQQKRSFIEESALIIRTYLYLHESRPDVVVSFGGHEFYYVFMFRRMCGYKLLVSERTDPYHPRSKGDRVRRFLYNLVDYAVFQTEEARHFFSARLQKRSVVIPNPAKFKIEGRWKSRSVKTVVTLSRIDLVQKRLDLIVEALGLMKEKANLLIYGNGTKSELDRLKKLITASPAKSRIQIMGPVDTPEAAFENGDVYVLSSDFEGIPNTIMEALSFGIPIISTDCSPGGARFLLGDGKYGTIVPRDDAHALSNALDAYFRDPSTSILKASVGMASIDRFNEDAIALSWLRTFQELNNLYS